MFGTYRGQRTASSAVRRQRSSRCCCAQSGSDVYARSRICAASRITAEYGRITRTISATYFPRRPSRRARTDSCLRWRTEWAARSRVRWLRTQPWSPYSRVSATPIRASLLADCCSVWCKTQTPMSFQVAVASGTAGAGMATTLVACALRHDRAVVAHVGDSRCYLIRRGEAIRLTRDHTVASEHERLGLLTAQEAAEADSRHVLSRSLGGGLVCRR